MVSNINPTMADIVQRQAELRDEAEQVRVVRQSRPGNAKRRLWKRLHRRRTPGTRTTSTTTAA